MVPKREAVALESPDGYSDGYNPDEIKADILGPKGERADYYNAQLELNLPIYLVHDVQSCVDLQMNIWGQMKDADYPEYVVKADLSTADGKECELPEVGVYSTKYLAEKISKDRRFPVACSSVTVACDLVTAGLSGPWGIFALGGDIGGCVAAPKIAASTINGTLSKMPVVNSPYVAGLGSTTFTNLVTKYTALRKGREQTYKQYRTLYEFANGLPTRGSIQAIDAESKSLAKTLELLKEPPSDFGIPLKKKIMEYVATQGYDYRSIDEIDETTLTGIIKRLYGASDESAGEIAAALRNGDLTDAQLEVMKWMKYDDLKNYIKQLYGVSDDRTISKIAAALRKGDLVDAQLTVLKDVASRDRAKVITALTKNGVDEKTARQIVDALQSGDAKDVKSLLKSFGITDQETLKDITNKVHRGETKNLPEIIKNADQHEVQQDPGFALCIPGNAQG